MTAAVVVAEPPRCPFCGEERLIERDPRDGRFVCKVCARTWTVSN